MQIDSRPGMTCNGAKRHHSDYDIINDIMIDVNDVTIWILYKDRLFQIQFRYDLNVVEITPLYLWLHCLRCCWLFLHLGFKLLLTCLNQLKSTRINSRIIKDIVAHSLQVARPVLELH